MLYAIGKYYNFFFLLLKFIYLHVHFGQGNFLLYNLARSFGQFSWGFFFFMIIHDTEFNQILE